MNRQFDGLSATNPQGIPILYFYHSIFKNWANNILMPIGAINIALLCTHRTSISCPWVMISLDDALADQQYVGSDMTSSISDPWEKLILMMPLLTSNILVPAWPHLYPVPEINIYVDPCTFNNVALSKCASHVSNPWETILLKQTTLIPLNGYLPLPIVIRNSVYYITTLNLAAKRLHSLQLSVHQTLYRYHK